jgi:hypothetical protein
LRPTFVYVTATTVEVTPGATVVVELVAVAVKVVETVVVDWM